MVRELHSNTDYELVCWTTSGKVFLGPPGHLNIRNPICLQTHTFQYTDGTWWNWCFIIATSGASRSCPPSTCSNVVTVCQCQRHGWIEPPSLRNPATLRSAGIPGSFSGPMQQYSFFARVTRTDGEVVNMTHMTLIVCTIICFTSTAKKQVIAL